MPNNKAKKGKGAGKKQAGKTMRAGKTTSPSPVPTATLDIAAHPSIFSNIVSFCSPRTLATLLRCNKSIFQLAVGRLYRNLHITQAGLERLIETAKAPSKRGSTSGLLGRGVSPYFKEASSQVNSLIIKWIGWGRGRDPLTLIPRGCFERVEQLVFDPEYAYEPVTMPYWARSLKPQTLITRRNAEEFLIVDQSDIPDTVKHVTVLIINTASIRTFEPIDLRTGWRAKTSIMTCAVTLVFLPGPNESSIYDSDAPNQPSDELLCPPPMSTPRKPICMVGCELFNTGETRVQDHMIQQMAQEGRSEEDKASLTFMRFEDWLKEQEPGSIFDEKEETKCRGLSKETRSGVRAR